MTARGQGRGREGDEAGEGASCALGRRWVAAFNGRDGDALVALADPEIAFHPSVIVGRQRVYHGHDGLRAWLADVEATKLGHHAHAERVRVSSAGDLVVSGRLLLGEATVSPFTMRFVLRHDRVLEAWSYLSEESLLEALGRVDRD